MPWLKLDDGFHENPKIVALSMEAVGAYVFSLSYAGRNLTDGFIPYRKAKEFCTNRARIVAELVPGLWEEVEGGYQIHDYLEYQRSRADVEEERSQKQPAKVAGGRVRAASAGRAGGRFTSNAPAEPPAEPPANSTSSAPASPAKIPIPITDPIPIFGNGDEIARACANFAKFGSVNSQTADLVEEAVTDFGIQLVERAIKQAQGSGVDHPPWNYVLSTLIAWKKNGVPNERLSTNGHTSRRGARAAAVGVTDGSDYERYLAGEG